MRWLLYILQPARDNFHNNFLSSSLRCGTERSEIDIEFSEVKGSFQNSTIKNYALSGENVVVEIYGNSKGLEGSVVYTIAGKSGFPLPLFSSSEPHNFICPFLSRRKPGSFSEQINIANAKVIREDMTHLYSRLDALLNPESKFYDEFRNICKAFFGFNIACKQEGEGKRGGLMVNEDTLIPVHQMGEGTTNILGFISQLCTSQNKVFLIEEPENDIHPKALKVLLDLILEKSKNNQFFISTHSNIVVKHLGGCSDSKLFHVGMNLEDKIPTSIINEISTPSQRRDVLSDLGYAFFDLDLWAGYLILEESTAERIIRDFLMPTFTPSLCTRLKTVAAGGVDRVELVFDDFLRLFVFIHLEPAYQNKAWVVVDGDDVGKAVIQKLHEKFSKWPPGNFRAFSKTSFENHYPARFSQEAAKVIAMANGLERNREKGKLAVNVLEWALANREVATQEFSESAAEIIRFLKEIEASLSKH